MYIANGQDPEHGEGLRPSLLRRHHQARRRQRRTRRRTPSSSRDPKPGRARSPRRRSPARASPIPIPRVIWHYDKYRPEPRRQDRSHREHMNRTISHRAWSTPKGCASPPISPASSTASTPRPARSIGPTTWNRPSGARRSCATARCISADETATCGSSNPARNQRRSSPTHNMGNALLAGVRTASPVFCNDTLYLMTRQKLFAIHGEEIA